VHNYSHLRTYVHPNQFQTIDNMSIDADQYDKITCEASSLNENKAKNRYVNILPCEH